MSLMFSSDDINWTVTMLFSMCSWMMWYRVSMCFVRFTTGFSDKKLLLYYPPSLSLAISRWLSKIPKCEQKNEFLGHVWNSNIFGFSRWCGGDSLLSGSPTNRIIFDENNTSNTFAVLRIACLVWIGVAFHFKLLLMSRCMKDNLIP